MMPFRRRQTDAALDELRAENARVRAAIPAVVRRPAPVVEAIARIDALLDGFFRNYQPPNLASFTTGDFDPRPLQVSHHLLTPGDVDGGLIWFARDQFRARLIEDLEAYYRKSGDPGLSAKERAAELADLNGQLLDLEVREERLIRASEEQGKPLERRDDADPAVVLARDLDLLQPPAPRRQKR